MKLDWQSTQTPDERAAQLATALPDGYVGEAVPCEMPSGRAAALQRLSEYDPNRYSRTRNFTDGHVSRLSPYLRHGMLTMVEVRDFIIERFTGHNDGVDGFLRQLAWRDFFLKVLDWYGTAVEDDLEPPKHTVEREEKLPSDIAQGRTGLPCMDGILANLFQEGYLHNHARLWFAAYLCHFRGLSWKVGAQLFRRHLLDGDIASNSLNWQWVASTFSIKPYFMNRENINLFSHGQWCDTCAVQCPFDATYEELRSRLFDVRVAPLAIRNRAEESE